MATTKSDIREWVAEAKQKKATHLLVVCDTFDWEDYPVPVMPGEDVHRAINGHSQNMQKVMECYNLSQDTEAQLLEHRAFHP